MKLKAIHYLYFAFFFALVATLGSLFFGEVLKYPPCTLCWYQRIAIWPLVPILGVGAWFNDKKVIYYAMPSLLIGSAISVYHNLLYYKIIPEALAPCMNGVSCTTVFINWFGFITIPFLALMTFALVITSLLLYRRQAKLEA